MRALLLLLPLAATSPASAGSAECLWNALGEAPRAAFLAAYEASDGAGLDAIAPPKDASFEKALRACGVAESDEAESAAARAAFGEAMAAGAGRHLAIRGVIAPDRLAALWTALTPPERSAIGDYALAAAEDRPAPEAIETLKRLDRLYRQAGWNGNVADPLLRHLVIYFNGRALAETFESRF
ncbi:MAG: hypothetical protein ABW360_06790 [Phenylobacterium sp.]